MPPPFAPNPLPPPPDVLTLHAAARAHPVLIVECLTARLTALHVLSRGIAIARAAQRIVSIHVLRALLQLAVVKPFVAAALPDVLHTLARRLIQVLPGALLQRLCGLRALC